MQTLRPQPRPTEAEPALNKTPRRTVVNRNSASPETVEKNQFAEVKMQWPFFLRELGYAEDGAVLVDIGTVTSCSPPNWVRGNRLQEPRGLQADW